MLPTLAHVVSSASAAESGSQAAPGKERPVTLERIAGSTVKRVVLSAKAAERLGIETSPVAEKAIVPTQMVGGAMVRSPDEARDAKPRTGGAAGFAKPSAGEAWIRVTLSPAEWGRLAKDKPARILPLTTRDMPALELSATPSARAPVEDPRTTMLTLYYLLPGGEIGVVPGDRVRVELQLVGATDKQKVVPYAAIYYDAKGAAWVYVNNGPLAYERQRVSVDRIAGNLAALSAGPPVGTQVVTVGASLLYGAEIFGK